MSDGDKVTVTVGGKLVSVGRVTAVRGSWVEVEEVGTKRRDEWPASAVSRK